MPNSTINRQQRLRRTKAQLIDEIDTLEQRATAMQVALSSMSDGIYIIDSNLNVIAFNQRYIDLLDFPEGLVREGRSIVDAVEFAAKRGDYKNQIDGDIDDVVAIRLMQLKSDEERLIENTTPTGRIVEYRGSPIKGGGFVSIMHDITERRRAEEELARKEAQLRVALDNMPGGMFMIDGEFTFQVFNDQFKEIFDIPDEILRTGGLLRDAIRFRAERGDYGPGDVNELVERRLREYTDKETLRTEERLPSDRVIELFRRPTDDGGTVAVVTDITERKQAEEELLEQKRRTEEASKLVTEKNQMLESLSNQLSKYLPPQVYDSIFSGKQTVEIASKRKKLTVFFSDIADFTETTDSLEPEELSNLLNHYLTEMSTIALEYGATIDKYVGDGITAFFGDPESRGVKEDARACVNMAMAMQRRMKELQSEWLDRGLEKPFQIRIGINTGYCTVGNFGSEDRMDYTINGSEVNLAARLESRAEVGGILLGHETYSLVKDTVLAEERDALTVKGFVKPVRSYAVVGLYDDLVHQGRIIRYDKEGLALVIDLNKRDKAEAIKALDDILSQLKG